MAKNYNDIYTAVYTKNNKMDFGNSMIRGNGIPLDITEVYNSYAAAESYVNSNPVAYEGQILAVTENNDTTVYVIAARLAADGESVEHYLKPVGSVPDVDGKTIIINNEGKLEAAIPEFEDTNTTYELKVEGVEGGIKITLTPSEGEAQSYTINDPDLSDYITSGELTEALANKADKSDVYTKTETDTKIGEAVAAADHLKRKIVDAPGAEETIDDVIDVNAADADQYIYMVPTGLQESDNKYREYIVIVDGDNRYIEQVGNWEVDLSGYLTVVSAEGTYAKKNDIETSYVKKTDLEDYETSATAESKYVAKENGKSLIADTEIERLAKVNENAEVNYIKSVDENRFTVTEAGKLELNDLTDYVKVADATVEDGLRFINQTEINKLNKLNLDGEDITISGSVNASQVKELYATVANIVKGSTTDLDPDTEGSQLGLGIQEGAQVNFINNINTDVFSIDGDKKLDLVKVPVGKLDGLDSWVEENRDAVTGLYPTTAATLLNNLDNTINNEETGLIAELTAVKARVLTNENSIKDHADRLDAIEYAMTWHNLEQNNI